MNKHEENYDAKRRWQETRIKQFSYVNYLVLTLALAILGFAVSLVAEIESFRDTQCILILRFHRLSLISFSASIVLGILCSYARLIDFRKTSKIAKLRYNSGGRTTSKIQELRSATKKLGKYSWCFLGWQIHAFIVGFVFLMIAILLWRSNS